MIYGMALIAGFVFSLKRRVLVITFKVKVYKDKWEPTEVCGMILLLLLLL